ncbi:hypothetical protein SEA_TRAAWW1_41 [Mycobacterium phage Traaww1]|nr:hypothetical protein SEA_TRAAWW1_41 [Mycobacterium phage Traaww1]
MPAPITTRGSGRAATVPAGIGYPKRIGPTGCGRPAGGCSSSGLQGRKHERGVVGSTHRAMRAPCRDQAPRKRARGQR